MAGVGAGEASEPWRRAQQQGCREQSREIPTQTISADQHSPAQKASLLTRQDGWGLGPEALASLEEKTYNNKPKAIKKIIIGTYISIITLNVKGLNAPTKRHRLAEWIQKQDPYICCLQEIHFRSKDTYRLKVRGWKKIFHANGNKRKLE